MFEAILAILVGLLLASEAFGSGSEKLVGPLRPFRTVIGVAALVVGVSDVARPRASRHGEFIVRGKRR